MMDKIKDVLGVVGTNTGKYASRIGCRTSAIARTVGPKRGAIALGVLATVIAVPFVVRFVKARRADAESDIVEEEQLEPGVQRRSRRRKGSTRRSNASAPA